LKAHTTAPVTVALSTSTWYTVRFEVIDNNLTLSLDGVVLASLPDPDAGMGLNNALGVGKGGLAMFHAAMKFDNVSFDATPAGQALLADDFEDGNSTGWTQNGGSWDVIVDGTKMYHQYDTNAATTARSTAGSSAWTDQVVEADLKPLVFETSGRWLGIMARYVDVNNYYYLKLAGPNVIELKKLSMNTPITLATATLAVNQGTTYAVKLEVIGTSLRAYVNGHLAARASDSQFPSGSAGVMTYGTTAEFDDVLVTAP
jgi:hypothetical protein